MDYGQFEIGLHAAELAGGNAAGGDATRIRGSRVTIESIRQPEASAVIGAVGVCSWVRSSVWWRFAPRGLLVLRGAGYFP